MGPHFMLLLSIYVLYSNVIYIYHVSCLVEIKLFQNCFKIVSMEDGTISVHKILKHQLKAEATKQRDYSNSSILSKELRAAAKELK